MKRSSPNSDMVDLQNGLGPHLVGKQIDINGHILEIKKQLGEGGFSFAYLVRTCDSDGGTADEGESDNFSERSNRQQQQQKSDQLSPRPAEMVLKITSVHNTSQRQMAEREARLLSTLSHPSIVHVYDHGLRESRYDYNDCSGYPNEDALNFDSSQQLSRKQTAQHLILMEHCEGGNAFDAINRMRKSPSRHKRYDLPSLIISFGQICNAVSYLHAQHPPVIHRDLKPVNFLIKNGAYKLCDFGSAVTGHTDLRTPEDRRKAEEVVNKTTTQMFRAPEMVDLYMSNKLTQSTDVWALGCCLYSLAFLQDCFEASNLAILSGNYKIPNDNPYGEGLAELIDRMLASNCKERADMSEVIMCLSALYSGRPLPKRKKRAGKSGEGSGERSGSLMGKGAYRTDGQGVRKESPGGKERRKVVEAKKLDPNSAAAKRKKASEVSKKRGNVREARNDHGGSNSFHGSSEDSFASFDKAFSDGGKSGQHSAHAASDSDGFPNLATGSGEDFASFDQAVFDDGNFGGNDVSFASGSDRNAFVDNFGDEVSLISNSEGLSSAFGDQCRVSGGSPQLFPDDFGIPKDVNASFGSSSDGEALINGKKKRGLFRSLGRKSKS